MRSTPQVKVTAIIPCAGQGKRMGTAVNKLFLDLGGRPLLAYTLDMFQSNSLIDEIILVVSPDDMSFCRREIVDKYRLTKIKQLVPGGKERQESVHNGLLNLDNKTELVLIHDGARPFLKKAVLERAVDAGLKKGAAVVGVPAKDTIKTVNSDLSIKETPDRQYLWQVQTPQIFRKEIISRAYREAAKKGWTGTDDASLVEKLGIPVYMVMGDYMNIKITTPEDLIFAGEMLRVMK